MVGDSAGIRTSIGMIYHSLGVRTSVHSSARIGLRDCLREFRGVGDDVLDLVVDLLQPRLVGDVASISRFFIWSIGSCSWRIRLTSSLLRYFAGSDIEWPR